MRYTGRIRLRCLRGANRDMRVFIAVGLALCAAGCRSTDPCDSVNGTCLTLTVEGPASARVDRLAIAASDLLTATASSSVPAAKSLPVALGLQIPPNLSGTLAIHVDGFLGATLVGAGDTSATVTAGRRSSAKVRLLVTGSMDGG